MINNIKSCVKKIFSSLLIAVMMCGISVPTTFAEGTDYTSGTRVRYAGTSSEEYTVTVPAELAPGDTGTVTATGTFDSTKTLIVAADETVTLVNSIDSDDTKTLDVTFNGIELTGSDTAEVSTTADVSVASISDALFGVWSGKLNYNVELVEETVLTVPGATFSDGATLTWDEVKLAKNGTKYGYSAGAITDTEIGMGAFSECISLTNIKIPDSVTTIDYFAFLGCYELKSVTIPDSVTVIGESAFSLCENLTSVTIPESITIIEYDMFECCAFTSIDIPDSVTEIGSYAFCNCGNLNSITIPESVTIIGENAFDGCTSLNEINYAGTIEQWNSITKEDWNDESSIIEVICVDGTISLS